LVLLVLHQELAELFFVDFDHAIFVLTFAFTFTFFHLLAVLVFLYLVFDVFLSIDHWSMAVVFFVLDLNLLLHAFDAIVFEFVFVSFLFLFFLFFLSIFVLFVDSCLNALLLFEDLHVGGLLFGCELIELLKVILANLSCICKVSHNLEVVGGLLLLHRYELVELLFIHTLETIILFGLSFAFSFFLSFSFTFFLSFGIFFALFVDTFSFFFTFSFLILVLSFVTHLFLVFIHAFSNHTVLHERLTSVLRWEVSSCEVEAVIVVCRHKEFSLFISEMLIWIMASFSEESDVSLKLFDLIKVVDESLRDLLDK